MRRFPAALLVALSLAVGSDAPAQQPDVRRDIRDSQARLDSIRQERTRLQREMETIQGRVRDASRELQNIGRQRAASMSALQELDFQAATLAESMEKTESELGATRARLRVRTNELNARLRAIYKRGRLHSLRVLLSAENFADLLNRYKYVHLMTVHERMMVEEVGRLERSLRAQEDTLRHTLARLDILRREKQDEVTALQQVERRHNTALREYERAQSRTAGTIQQLTRDEARLSDFIRELERRRVEEERRAEAAGVAARPGAISTRSLGSLAWPVEGDVIYRYGPERRPNNVVIRNNGIGIASPVGTQVRSVEAGTVTMARPMEGYGPMVMLSHGGGYYTLYLYLGTVNVREGQQVPVGHVLGTVGAAQGTDSARLEFRVLVPFEGGPPQAVDPLDWLRARAAR